jgi:hypothetical protein
MPIAAIRSKTPEQVYIAVDTFATRYVADWNRWIFAEGQHRSQLFGRILRKWQATRPKRMRRLQEEAQHDPPFLDDLIQQAQLHLRTIEHLTLTAIKQKTTSQDEALGALWAVFELLPVEGQASCVGITKAILLLTNGRIGPALDSRVRQNLSIGRLSNAVQWISLLEDIGDDISSFEAKNHLTLQESVPIRFVDLELGRLYDMALGPR